MYRSHSMLARITLLTVSLGLVAAMGCARPARVVIREPQAQVVTVAYSHKHTSRCGHYRKGNTWYLVKGHVHGKRCGHVKVQNVWVIR